MSSNAVSMITMTRDADGMAGHRAATAPARTAARLAAQHGKVAGWADLLGSPSAESTRSRDLAHLGGFTAMAALIGYLTWRVAFTLPATGANLVAAWTTRFWCCAHSRETGVLTRSTCARSRAGHRPRSSSLEG
jgi:hypothetical protein